MIYKVLSPIMRGDQFLIKEKKMNKKVITNLFTRLLLLMILGHQLWIPTFAQNEFFEQASLEHVTHEFSINSDYGQADFALHTTKNSEKHAYRVQEILTSKAKDIFNYFQYVPESRIHFRLNFSATRANGSATVFPRNIIVLNMFPPSGSEHLVTSDDWLQGLVLHELVHIVHMDRTEGFLDTITSIFGSIGKFGGVVPRWFSEGLATWAETHFTKGGRLRNDGLVAQAKYFLAQDNFCHSIDCLDAPGEYPYGNFSYWVGGLFLDYLESLKAGTLACIVQENSDNIPFFLRDAIEGCTGRRLNVEGLFAEFRENLLRPKKVQDSFLNGQKSLINTYEESQPLYERGYEIKGDNLYWVSQNRDHVRLKKYDLATNELNDLYKNYHVDQIIKNEKNAYFSTSNYRRLWEQKKIRDDQDGVIGRGDFVMTYKGTPAFWRFNKKSWRLYQNDKEVYALPELVDLIDARNDLILIKRNNSYLLYNVMTKMTVRKSLSASRILDQCEGATYLKERDALVMIKTGQEYLLSNKWTKDLISLKTNGSHTVYRLNSLPDRLVHRELSCSKLNKKMVKAGKRKKIKSAKEVIHAVTILKTAVDSHDYPQLKHFKPHWWFFSYLAGDVITQLTLSTSINDPLDRHQLNLNLQYFDGVNKIHPTGSYTYNWSGTDIGLGASQSYIQNISRSSPDKDSSYFAFVARSFFWRNLTYRPSFNVSYFEDSDIISSRKGQEQTFVQRIIFSSLFRDDFFQGAQLTSLTRHFSVEEGQSYFGQELRLKSDLQPLTRLYTTLQASYGKLYKDGLSDGILYSGGANDYDTNTLHEFIGLNPNSAFGNEVTSARFLMNYELWRIQRGSGFVPLSLRTVNALAGSDYLKTDYIYSPSGYNKKSFAQSYYIGARANVTFAYFVPMQLDVLQVRVNRDVGTDTNETRFFLRGTLPF
jgi:hypothetical protein